MAIEPVDHESAEPTPASAPPRHRLRNLLIFGVIASLAMFSFWASKQVRSHLAHEDVTEDPVPEAPAKKPIDSGELLARGDNALRQHRLSEARACYQDLFDNGLTQTAAMRYRLALCSEVLGKIDDAIDSYRKAISISSTRSLTLAAHLGMARCLLRQDRGDEARQLIVPYLFDETRLKDVNEDIVTEAYYLLALSLVHGNLHREEPISYAGVPLEPLMHLEEIVDGAVERDDVVAAPKPSPLRVKIQKDNGSMVLSAEQPNRPAVELLTELASEGGLKIEWTAQAKKTAEDRTLNLYLHDWQLRDVLELAADHIDLVCLIDGDKVQLMTPAEATLQQRTAMQHGLLQRTLQIALHADATHPFTAAVLLELGNNDFARKRWNEAMAWYGRLTRENPSSPYIAAAHFNTACAHLYNHHPDRARKAFYAALDQLPGDDLSLRASIRIAQLHLDDDETEKAIIRLRHSLARSAHASHLPLASLTLALSHLSAGDAEATREVLGQHRIAVLQQPHRAAASFLDAYAAYRIWKVKGSSGGAPAVNDLVEVLWQNKDDINLGLQGQWLIAQAYADLGFGEQAERLLKKAQAAAHGNFKARVDLTLADLLTKKGMRADARKLLEKWIEPDTAQRTACRFHLARLNLEEHRYGECADACAKLWKERAISDEPALLATWGAALEGLGDLNKAAKCYAGMPPE
jgi:tetratricopeptide (TPR) repeat protein